MSDIKLFRLNADTATEIPGASMALERPLQRLIESNLNPLLGIRFVASEYSTGKTHAGRIDTLGLDENACPVILEYKRQASENVINQGLFYLDWLMDHQAEFQLLVLERFGKETADGLDWSAPRLICIAADFTKFDGHAVRQINRNIELIRYRKFGDQLLMLELVNSVSSANTSSAPSAEAKPAHSKHEEKHVSDWIETLPSELGDLFKELENYLLGLGDDVQRKDLKLYVAFRRLRNFVTVVPRQRAGLLLFLHLDPTEIEGAGDFIEDVRSVGHWGTGDTKIVLATPEDLERAKPLLQAAYDGRAK